MTERRDKIVEFLKEIEKFKYIERRILLENRKESDAEHAWHLAMFVFLFEKDLPKDLNFLKMFKLALMHDLVEIYAGDTFIFDEEGKKTKKEREAKAALKLFSQLPEDLEKDFHELFNEWEESKTREAKFVHSFDKIQPMIQNLSSNKKSLVENKISYEQLDKTKRKFFEHDEKMIDLYEKVMEEIRDII